jgi:glycosyltransferase involved in cell wall biosynthesis
MRVLQLCPLWYPIAHSAPGGIESLLAHLGPRLADAGCSLTYLASGDSEVPGELVAAVTRSVCALIEEHTAACYEFYEQHQLRLAVERLADSDIVHSHIGSGALLLSTIAPASVSVIHTLHSPVLDDLIWYLRRNPHVVLTTVSEFQRDRIRTAGLPNPCHVVYNGIDVESFPFCASPSERAVFMGRIEAQKGADLAVQAAADAGVPIDVAGPLTSPDFFEGTLSTLMTDPSRYVGIVRGPCKLELLSRASCMLMPSRWAEPFGMSAIEAMACGTPVVALRSGALPEIVEDGISGYVVDHPGALPDAIGAARHLDRATVRRRTAERFDIAVTTRRFVGLYESLLGARRH